MIAIIAEINSESSSDYFDKRMLRDGCMEAGAEQVSIVQTTDELKDAVIENKYKNILLFSNFPPDSSYPDSGKKINQVDKGDYIERSWEADSYSKSIDYFKHLFAKQKFITIHFITGAPKQRLSEKQLKSLSPETRITVVRKKDLINIEQDYSKTIRNYIIERIKAVSDKNPFI